MEDHAERIRRVEELLVEARQACEAIASSSSSSGSAVARLTAAVRDKVAAVRRELRTMELEAQQQDMESDRDAMLVDWKSFTGALDTLRVQLRNSNLQAMVNSEKELQRQRNDLLAGASDTLRVRKAQTQAEQLETAEDITQSLRRTRQLMVQELEHGTQQISALGDSNTRLLRTKDEYKSQQGLYGASRRLLTTLQQQGVIDRIVLVGGFFLFMLVAVYIFQKRVLKRRYRVTDPVEV
eukprot:jgi/Chlat1/4887/Chrsp31S04901